MHKSLVVYGTSLSAEKAFFWRCTGGDWVRLLRDALNSKRHQNILLTNASRWGATSDWGRRYLKKRVLKYDPHSVILEFAINDADINREISLHQAGENLNEMIRQIRRYHPSCIIFVMTMNPCTGRYADLRPDLTDYYEMYRYYADAHNLPLIDLEPVWKRWMSENSGRIAEFLPDGIHPSPQASAELIFPAVKKHVEATLSFSARS
jgi:lysophospholipase L1-like esterase